MVQGKTFAGWLARTFPAYRDRLIEDPRFFFKVRLRFHADLKTETFLAWTFTFPLASACKACTPEKETMTSLQ